MQTEAPMPPSPEAVAPVPPELDAAEPAESEPTSPRSPPIGPRSLPNSPRGPRKPHKPSRAQRRAAAAAVAAAEGALSSAPPSESGPPPFVAIVVQTKAEAEPVSPRGGELDGALSPRDVASPRALDEEVSRAALPIPFFLRMRAIPVFHILFVWPLQIWLIIASLVLVLPLRALAFLIRRPLRRPLHAARALAQRPLLALTFGLGTPLYLSERSWGLDMSRFGQPPPRSLEDLLAVLKASGRNTRLAYRIRLARRGVANAGVSMHFIEAAAFSPGVEHRRLILKHCLARNSGLLGLSFVTFLVGALHSFTADVLEFRDGSGALVAFSTVAQYGSWISAPVYAALQEHARSGVWLANMAAWMERLLPDERCGLIDVGPTMGELKAMSGLHLLPLGRAARMAAFG